MTYKGLKIGKDRFFWVQKLKALTWSASGMGELENIRPLVLPAIRNVA
jgi:hypothetical protein